MNAVKGTDHPLGSIARRARAARPTSARILALAVLAGCTTLMAVAVRLHPAEKGLGTHQQLGLGPCSVAMLTGYPCPTCGMTTAFALGMRGSLLAALHAQPAGLLFVFVTIVAALGSVDVLVTGKVWTVNWFRVLPGYVIILVFSIPIVGWVYKLSAGLLAGTLPMRP